MGSCISKCKPKKKFKEDCSHVHDKLVISQDPISLIPQNITPMLLPSDKPLSPAPSSSSKSSFSSFSCSTNSKCTMSSSTSSSSSSSSSVVITKDRSFSNEFLWSCVKENPHIITQKPVVTANKNLDPSSLVPKVKLPSNEEKPVTPKKRARSNSPTLTRQKSFRKEQNPASSVPNRGLRWPSPSRRFNGDNMSRTITTNMTNENSYRRQSLSNSKATNAVNSCPKKESFRASPNRDLMMRSRNLSVRKKDVLCEQVSAKNIDGVDDECRKEMDIVMEDINNPLIALDCFIFL